MASPDQRGVLGEWQSLYNEFLNAERTIETAQQTLAVDDPPWSSANPPYEPSMTDLAVASSKGPRAPKPSAMARPARNTLPGDIIEEVVGDALTEDAVAVEEELLRHLKSREPSPDMRNLLSGLYKRPQQAPPARQPSHHEGVPPAAGFPAACARPRATPPQPSRNPHPPHPNVALPGSLPVSQLAHAAARHTAASTQGPARLTPRGAATRASMPTPTAAPPHASLGGRLQSPNQYAAPSQRPTGVRASAPLADAYYCPAPAHVSTDRWAQSRSPFRQPPEPTSALRRTMSMRTSPGRASAPSPPNAAREPSPVQNPGSRPCSGRQQQFTTYAGLHNQRQSSPPHQIPPAPREELFEALHRGFSPHRMRLLLAAQVSATAAGSPAAAAAAGGIGGRVSQEGGSPTRTRAAAGQYVSPRQPQSQETHGLRGSYQRQPSASKQRAQTAVEPRRQSGAGNVAGRRPASGASARPFGLSGCSPGHALHASQQGHLRQYRAGEGEAVRRGAPQPEGASRGPGPQSAFRASAPGPVGQQHPGHARDLGLGSGGMKPGHSNRLVKSSSMKAADPGSGLRGDNNGAGAAARDAPMQYERSQGAKELPPTPILHLSSGTEPHSPDLFISPQAYREYAAQYRQSAPHSVPVNASSSAAGRPVLSQPTAPAEGANGGGFDQRGVRAMQQRLSFDLETAAQGMHAGMGSAGARARPASTATARRRPSDMYGGGRVPPYDLPPETAAAAEGCASPYTARSQRPSAAAAPQAAGGREGSNNGQGPQGAGLGLLDPPSFELLEDAEFEYYESMAGAAAAAVTELGFGSSPSGGNAMRAAPWDPGNEPAAEGSGTLRASWPPAPSQPPEASYGNSVRTPRTSPGAVRTAAAPPVSTTSAAGARTWRSSSPDRGAGSLPDHEHSFAFMQQDVRPTQRLHEAPPGPSGAAVAAAGMDGSGGMSADALSAAAAAVMANAISSARSAGVSSLAPDGAGAAAGAAGRGHMVEGRLSGTGASSSSSAAAASLDIGALTDQLRHMDTASLELIRGYASGYIDGRVQALPQHGQHQIRSQVVKAAVLSLVDDALRAKREAEAAAAAAAAHHAGAGAAGAVAAAAKGSRRDMTSIAMFHEELVARIQVAAADAAGQGEEPVDEERFGFVGSMPPVPFPGQPPHHPFSPVTTVYSTAVTAAAVAASGSPPGSLSPSSALPPAPDHLGGVRGGSISSLHSAGGLSTGRRRGQRKRVSWQSDYDSPPDAVTPSAESFDGEDLLALAPAAAVTTAAAPASPPHMLAAGPRPRGASVPAALLSASPPAHGSVVQAHAFSYGQAGRGAAAAVLPPKGSAAGTRYATITGTGNDVAVGVTGSHVVLERAPDALGHRSLPLPALPGAAVASAPLPGVRREEEPPPREFGWSSALVPGGAEAVVARPDPADAHAPFVAATSTHVPARVVSGAASQSLSGAVEAALAPHPSDSLLDTELVQQLGRTSSGVTAAVNPLSMADVPLKLFPNSAPAAPPQSAATTYSGEEPVNDGRRRSSTPSLAQLVAAQLIASDGGGGGMGGQAPAGLSRTDPRGRSTGAGGSGSAGGINRGGLQFLGAGDAGGDQLGVPVDRLDCVSTSMLVQASLRDGLALGPLPGIREPDPLDGQAEAGREAEQGPTVETREAVAPPPCSAAAAPDPAACKSTAPLGVGTEQTRTPTMGSAVDAPQAAVCASVPTSYLATEGTLAASRGVDGLDAAGLGKSEYDGSSAVVASSPTGAGPSEEPHSAATVNAPAMGLDGNSGSRNLPNPLPSQQHHAPSPSWGAVDTPRLRTYGSSPVTAAATGSSRASPRSPGRQGASSPAAHPAPIQRSPVRAQRSSTTEVGSSSGGGAAGSATASPVSSRSSRSRSATPVSPHPAARIMLSKPAGAAFGSPPSSPASNRPSKLQALSALSSRISQRRTSASAGAAGGSPAYGGEYRTQGEVSEGGMLLVLDVPGVQGAIAAGADSQAGSEPAAAEVVDGSVADAGAEERSGVEPQERGTQGTGAAEPGVVQKLRSESLNFILQLEAAMAAEAEAAAKSRASFAALFAGPVTPTVSLQPGEIDAAGGGGTGDAVLPSQAARPAATAVATAGGQAHLAPPALMTGRRLESVAEEQAVPEEPTAAVVAPRTELPIGGFTAPSRGGVAGEDGHEAGAAEVLPRPLNIQPPRQHEKPTAKDVSANGVPTLAEGRQPGAVQDQVVQDPMTATAPASAAVQPPKLASPAAIWAAAVPASSLPPPPQPEDSPAIHPHVSEVSTAPSGALPEGASPAGPSLELQSGVPSGVTSLALPPAASPQRLPREPPAENTPDSERVPRPLDSEGPPPTRVQSSVTPALAAHSEAAAESVTAPPADVSAAGNPLEADGKLLTASATLRSAKADATPVKAAEGDGRPAPAGQATAAAGTASVKAWPTVASPVWSAAGRSSSGGGGRGSAGGDVDRSRLGPAPMPWPLPAGATVSTVPAGTPSRLSATTPYVSDAAGRGPGSDAAAPPAAPASSVVAAIMVAPAVTSSPAAAAESESTGVSKITSADSMEGPAASPRPHAETNAALPRVAAEAVAPTSPDMTAVTPACLPATPAAAAAASVSVASPAPSSSDSPPTPRPAINAPHGVALAYLRRPTAEAGSPRSSTLVAFPSVGASAADAAAPPSRLSANGLAALEAQPVVLGAPLSPRTSESKADTPQGRDAAATGVLTTAAGLGSRTVELAAAAVPDAAAPVPASPRSGDGAIADAVGLAVGGKGRSDAGAASQAVGSAQMAAAKPHQTVSSASTSSAPGATTGLGAAALGVSPVAAGTAAAAPPGGNPVEPAAAAAPDFPLQPAQEVAGTAASAAAAAGPAAPVVAAAAAVTPPLLPGTPSSATAPIPPPAIATPTAIAAPAPPPPQPSTVPTPSETSPAGPPPDTSSAAATSTVAPPAPATSSTPADARVLPGPSASAVTTTAADGAATPAEVGSRRDSSSSLSAAASAADTPGSSGTCTPTRTRGRDARSIEPVLSELRAVRAAIATEGDRDGSRSVRMAALLAQLDSYRRGVERRHGASHSIATQLRILHADMSKWLQTNSGPGSSSNNSVGGTATPAAGTSPVAASLPRSESKGPAAAVATAAQAAAASPANAVAAQPHAAASGATVGARRTTPEIVPEGEQPEASAAVLAGAALSLSAPRPSSSSRESQSSINTDATFDAAVGSPGGTLRLGSLAGAPAGSSDTFAFPQPPPQPQQGVSAGAGPAFSLGGSMPTAITATAAPGSAASLGTSSSLKSPPSSTAPSHAGTMALHPGMTHGSSVASTTALGSAPAPSLSAGQHYGPSSASRPGMLVPSLQSPVGTATGTSGVGMVGGVSNSAGTQAPVQMSLLELANQLNTLTMQQQHQQRSPSGGAPSSSGAPAAFLPGLRGSTAPSSSQAGAAADPAVGCGVSVSGSVSLAGSQGVPSARLSEMGLATGAGDGGGGPGPSGADAAAAEAVAPASVDGSQQGTAASPKKKSRSKWATLFGVGKK